jgi:hypothetical protein
MPAFVIINRPADRGPTNFVLYVAMAATREEALAAVLDKFRPVGDCEVNGKELAEATAAALGLLPGDVRAM